MNKARWVSATAGAAMIAATLALPTAGVAYASGNGNVTGNGNISVLSGNTIDAPVSVPVNLCGVSLGIIGFANSGCEGGASSHVSTDPSGGGNGGGNGNVTGIGNVGLGSGNTITAPISAPVNVCGVSGAVGGFANSDCKGGAHSNVTLGNGGGNGGGNGNVTGIGNVSGASGNTITAPVSAPVNLCSISLALLGFSNSGCEGGATRNVTTGTQGSNGNVTGIGNVGLGSGNTINAPVSAPVNVCGVSTAVAGFANSDCKGGSSSCIGQDCNQPSCHGDHCMPCQDQVCNCHSDRCVPCGDQTCVCHGDQCVPCICHGDHCVPCVCHGDHCVPCEGQMCHCHGDHCTPPGCHGDHCTPPGCHGDHCTPPGGCHGSSCTPPGGCQANCTPPVTPPHGTHPGTTTTVTNASGPVSTGLPTTGADLLLLGVAAIGTVGVGAGAVTLTRRRRNGAAS
jgi:small secreted domain DUF320